MKLSAEEERRRIFLDFYRDGVVPKMEEHQPVEFLAVPDFLNT